MLTKYLTCSTLHEARTVFDNSHLYQSLEISDRYCIVTNVKRFVWYRRHAGIFYCLVFFIFLLDIDIQLWIKKCFWEVYDLETFISLKLFNCEFRKLPIRKIYHKYLWIIWNTNLSQIWRGNWFLFIYIFLTQTIYNVILYEL